MRGIKEWRNKKNGFYVIRVHYTADDRKTSEAWKFAQSQGIPTNDWNREYEIDFSTFTGKPVFLHDYDDSTMCYPLETLPNYPILRSWDMGFHMPSVSWGQFVDGSQLRILQSDYGQDVDFRTYVRKIQHLSAVYFPGRTFLDCCDQAAKQVKSTGDTELRILVNEFGIVPRYRYFRVQDTLDRVRLLMHSTYKLKPAFLVNETESTILLREALRGGYHYAEKVEGRAQKEEPFQDGYYENLVDPIRYMVMNFCETRLDHFEEMTKMAGIDVPQERPVVW